MFSSSSLNFHTFQCFMSGSMCQTVVQNRPILFAVMVSSFCRAAFLVMCAFNSIRSISYLVDGIGAAFGHGALFVDTHHSTGTKNAVFCLFIMPEISMHGKTEHLGAFQISSW